MRKVFLFMMVSLDGYFEMPNHDLSWHHVDTEFNEAFAIRQLEEIDTLLFGRKTYEMMASFWPTDLAKDDPIVARLMNETPKVVFSHTLDKTDWSNTTLVADGAAEEVSRLKNQPGKDIAIFGSNNLCVSLMQDDLVDEFRIMINPVVVGAGTRLFDGIKDKVEMKRTANSREFKNGNVLLTYRVK